MNTRTARIRSQKTSVLRLFQRSTSPPATGPRRIAGAVNTRASCASARPPEPTVLAAPTRALSAMWCSLSPSCDTVCPSTDQPNGGSRSTDINPSRAPATAATFDASAVNGQPLRLEDEPLIGVLAHDPAELPGDEASDALDVARSVRGRGTDVERFEDADVAPLA